MTKAKPSALDLSSLIASRVCHDIISPVGAVGNGLEVLDDGDSSDMHDFAMDLIRKSAEQASVKLQFARLAFGASGSAGSSIDMAEAASCCERLFARDKVDLAWLVSEPTLPKSEAKLLLNLIILGANAIARGGTLEVRVDRGEAGRVLEIAAVGDRAGLNDQIARVLTDGDVPDPLDAHSVQPYYSVLLAEQAGLAIRVGEDEGVIRLKAVPAH